MVKTFMFDKMSPYWSHDHEINKMFIEMNTRWLYDFFKLDGYVYLNKIYNIFGAYWNPDEPNDCIRYGVNDFVMSWTDLGDNRFEINIYY